MMKELTPTILFWPILLLCVNACGDDGPGSRDAGAADAAVVDGAVADATLPDAGPSRPFHLSASGVRLTFEEGLFLGPAHLDEDVDLISIHEGFIGLPWQEFEQGISPPAAWVAAMDDLVAQTQAAGKGVFLSLQLVGGPGRKYLAARTVINGTTVGREAAWSAECYDFATEPDGDAKRLAYTRFVDWMVRRFDPVYINVAVEINMFHVCGAAWDGLVDVERAAYDAAKLAKPEVIAFPSIQLDFLHGYLPESCPGGDRPQCFEDNYAALVNLKRDRFAVSTYPYLFGFDDPADLPDDWFTRAGDRGSEPMVIAETGWIATDAVALHPGGCVTALVSTPEEQAAYFELVVAAAEDRQMDLLTWFSDEDVIPAGVMTDCPCTIDASWCGLIDAFRSSAGSDPLDQFFAELSFKSFGTMGLRDRNGVPRTPIHDRWTEIQALPIVPAL